MDVITIPILLTAVLIGGAAIGYLAGSWQVYLLKQEITALKSRLEKYE